MEDTSLMIAMFGGFISLLLTINAFFTRSTLQKIISIELRLVEYITKHDSISEMAHKNAKDIDAIAEMNRRDLTILRERTHNINNQIAIIKGRQESARRENHGQS